MKKRYIAALLSFVFSACATSSFAQMVGDCVFLKGKYVEVGIAPNGGYGSTLPAPAGYHPNLGGGGFTFFDPGAGTASTSSNLLGFVADYGSDGWTVGTPPYFGDYYLPGTPQEGWSIITGTSPESQAYIPAYWTSAVVTGYTGGLAGTNVSYSNVAGVSKGVWQGADGPLSIRQTTTLDTNKLYFTINVVLINTSTTTAIPDIYYIRTVDPDNEQTITGSFQTINTITYQLPNPENKVLVGTTGNTLPAAYVGLGTKDCRAKCSIFHLGGLVPASNPMAVHNETASPNYLYAQGATSTEDVGIGLTFNVGTLAPGDSTSLSYAYILNATYIDSALNSTLPQFLIDASLAADTTRDTINFCDHNAPINITMANGGFYHWSYSPGTYLTTTTGPTTTIHTDSITADITYEVTGISPCDTVHYYLTILHAPYAGPVTTPVTYCQFAPSGPLTVPGLSPEDTLVWWTSATGGVGTEIAPWPNTSIPGTTTYYVSEHHGLCVSDRAPLIVTISPQPPAPSIGGLSPYCFGAPFVPFVTSVPGILWYTGPTGGIGSTTAPTIFTGAAGTFTVYATQTVSGCEGARASFVTTVMPKILPGFSFDKHYGCHGDTVKFTNSSLFSNHYTWSFGDGYSDTAVNPSHIYYNQGTYTVTGYALNSANCIDSIKQSFDLLHAINSVFTATPTVICQNQSIAFTNGSIGVDSTFRWYFGNGDVDTVANPTHMYPRTGVYTVSLVVKDFVPCYDTSTTVVYVDTISGIRLDITDSVLCAGTYATFTGQYASIGNTGITWSFGDDDSMKNKNPIYHGFQAGEYFVKATAHYRACQDTSITRKVVVLPQPTIDLGRDTSICKGSEAILLRDHSNYTNSSASYLWNTGERGKSISVAEPGQYFATVTINNCHSADSIVVANDCYMNIPNAFTPNGDGINDYFYPRQLLARGLTSFKMNIYNRWGQLIFETSTTDGAGWDGKLNGTDQPGGVYVYSIDAAFKDGQHEHHQGNVTLLR